MIFLFEGDVLSHVEKVDDRLEVGGAEPDTLDTGRISDIESLVF
jgi:hypothetical protein